MKEIFRLDKYLCDMNIGTRSEVKGYIKKGRVTVNGVIAKSPDLKIRVNDDKIKFDNQNLKFQKYEYYMLNKPAGVVSATIDNVSKTVIELITTSNKKDLFPVGRLDKDTEGLLLITNDGELAHQLLSPKKHVSKTYFAKVKGHVNNIDVEMFQKGIQLEDDFTTLPADLKILKTGEVSEVEVTIYEGKFHQIKRMFQKVDKEVVYLKRLSMGPLIIDPELKNGEYRSLLEEEILLLKDTKESVIG
ncbi:16S rRNA pseudouridine516 synthase [Mobilisporobacter senegalensis]|uniref:Pseudouridine synthase n=1 Tax=Mobilisporobacter senegalensis TaxID=1329262 RepID=A0A3N1XVY7_9FIRM|nr:pseudouridine synthase [Mobilisporobacter senegalensis]ROR29342.1 16S rRNA pseudouridine516 synthase [Mobilisporobacter senegalensis]